MEMPESVPLPTGGLARVEGEVGGGGEGGGG